MFAQFAITLVADLALMLVTTNLIGFLVRGLFARPQLEVEDDYVRGLVHQQEKRVNIVALALLIAFFLALYHFWNVGVVLAASMLMAARVPDLVWEIRHGRKIRMREMSEVPLYVLTTALSWMSLPVLWYALYRM